MSDDQTNTHARIVVDQIRELGKEGNDAVVLPDGSHVFIEAKDGNGVNVLDSGWVEIKHAGKPTVLLPPTGATAVVKAHKALRADDWDARQL